MEHCNGFPTPTNFEKKIGIDANGSEAKRLDQFMCFYYRDDAVSSIKHKTRYLLCCSPVYPFYT